MLTAGDALVKTLVKSQKVTFGAKKIVLDAFFLLIVGDVLNGQTSHYILDY